MSLRLWQPSLAAVVMIERVRKSIWKPTGLGEEATRRKKYNIIAFVIGLQQHGMLGLSSAGNGCVRNMATAHNDVGDTARPCAAQLNRRPNLKLCSILLYTRAHGPFPMVRRFATNYEK